MPVKLGAVADHGAFQMLTEQPQPFDQGVDRPQGRPGYIVGVDLIAAHHQQRRTVRGRVVLRQQPVDAQQAVGGRVMGLAAGAVQQLLDAAAQDEVRRSCIAVQQMRRPGGDAGAVIDQQVVLDQFIAGQGNVQRHINQMHKCMGTHGNHRALPGIEANIAHALQAQRQLQRPRAHQPQHQPRGFQASQQRAGQHGWQRLRGIGYWQRLGHPGYKLLKIQRRAMIAQLTATQAKVKWPLRLSRNDPPPPGYP